MIIIIIIIYEIFLHQSLLILRVLKLLSLVTKTLNTQTLQSKPETPLKQQQLEITCTIIFGRLGLIISVCL